MSLSIIIPTYNEAAAIGKLLGYLQQHISVTTELIVADGGSTDTTVTIAKQAGAQVIVCWQKGRSRQMNEAASKASGQVLYFLHADTFPPVNFEQQIMQAIGMGYSSGCFRLRFDEHHWFLQTNAWFTRFNIDAIRFGDQSLFVRQHVFLEAGCFNDKLLLLEDQEIISRLKQKGRFKLVADYVITSARKYREVGVYKLQAGYYLIFTLYKAGISQRRLLLLYKWLLR